ncbi:MAG: hypothetical protein Ta2E_01590 [Mycoplasmoidaceae bacterium]|nr:MAG: hypothetical protein Ta2E_01590 [Mycoplasmoidaceae bacterium]
MTKAFLNWIVPNDVRYVFRNTIARQDFNDFILNNNIPNINQRKTQTKILNKKQLGIYITLLKSSTKNHLQMKRKWWCNTTAYTKTFGGRNTKANVNIKPNIKPHIKQY